jgi:hypothetical protein
MRSLGQLESRLKGSNKSESRHKISMFQRLPFQILDMLFSSWAVRFRLSVRRLARHASARQRGRIPLGMIRLPKSRHEQI